MYFSVSISLFVSKSFCGEIFETLVILSAFLFPIKSPVASVFSEEVLSASVAGCLA